MTYKTFADYLMQHGLTLPDDTVVLDIQHVTSEGITDENQLLPPIETFIEKRNMPIFDNLLVQFRGKDNIWLGFLFSKIDMEEGEHKYSNTLYMEAPHGFKTHPGECSLMAFDDNGVLSGYSVLEHGIYDHNADLSFADMLGLYAFSLIHERHECKLHTYSRQVRRYVKRKTGKAPSPYFMLEIGKTVKYNSGGSISSDDKQKRNREHLVRGHFRIVIGHPLKWFNGTSWIASYLRGDPGGGKTTKDYRIILPEREGQS